MTATRRDPRQLRRIRIYPADKWNRHIERFRLNRPLEIRVDRSAGFRHPWHTRVTWDGSAEQFAADIQAGYVRDEEVLVRIPAENASQETLRRLSIAEPEAGQHLDAYLSEQPQIPIRKDVLRAIGTDAIALAGQAEPVPEFFALQGVQDPTEITVNETSGVTFTENGDPVAPQKRLLRAADMVLRKPRPSLTPEWSYQGGTLQLTPLVANPGSLEEPARIIIQKKYEPPEATRELIAAALVDTPYSEILIGTIYLLSPDQAPAGSDPDETWTGYMQQREEACWNFQYDIYQKLDAGPQTSRLSFPLPLAGGIAQPLIDSFLNANNSAAQQVANLLNDSKIEGTFWT